MSDPKLSADFFDKGIKSIKLSFELLFNQSLVDHRDSAIGELFHGFELLLKSKIVKHNKYLLLQETKTVVDKNWRISNFDERITKSANELPRLLFLLEQGSANYSFLQDNEQLVEKLRTERNRQEHGAASVTPNYISLILAPFFHKVILRLISADGDDYKKYFSDDERVQLIDSSSQPEANLPDPNKYYLVSHSCITCGNPYAFLQRNNKDLHCLICDTDVIANTPIAFHECPICEGEIITYDQKIVCNSDCTTEFKPTKPLANHECCPHCNSTEIYDLRYEIGSREGLCLGCFSVLDFWKCDECEKYRVATEISEPPQNISNAILCEDCCPQYWEAYEVPEN